VTTVDRLNALLRRHGLEEVATSVLATTGDWQAVPPSYNPYPAHSRLDLLDRAAGIDTSGAYVGARLALHERVCVKTCGFPMTACCRDAVT
jgi:hypothetical protein